MYRTKCERADDESLEGNDGNWTHPARDSHALFPQTEYVLTHKKRLLLLSQSSRGSIEKKYWKEGIERKTSTWCHFCTPTSQLVFARTSSLFIPNVPASFLAHQGHYWIKNKQKLRGPSVLSVHQCGSLPGPHVCSFSSNHKLTTKLPSPFPHAGSGFLCWGHGILRE